MRVLWFSFGGCLLLTACFSEPSGLSGSGPASTEGAESSTSDSDAPTTAATETATSTTVATDTTTNTTTGPGDTSSSDGGSSSTGDVSAELPPDIVRLPIASFGIDINALSASGSGFLLAGNLQVANPTNRDPVLIALTTGEADIWRLGTVGNNEQGWAVATKPSGAALVGLARDSASDVDGALLAVTNADFEPIASWRRTATDGRPIQARAVIPADGGWITAGHVGGQSIYVERVGDDGTSIQAVELSFGLDTTDLFPLGLHQTITGRIALLVQAQDDNGFTSLVLTLDGEDDLSPLEIRQLSVVGEDFRMSDIQSVPSGWVLSGEVGDQGAVVELSDTLEVVSGSTYTLPRLGGVRVRGATVWIAGGGTGSAMAGVLTPDGAAVIETPIDAPPVFLPAAVVAGVDNLAMAGDIDGEPVVVSINEAPTAACQMQPWGSSLGSAPENLSPDAQSVGVTTTEFSIDQINLPVPTEPTSIETTGECL